MAFNPNIPQPNDALSQSQADILANFQAIAPLFNQGIQQFVKLPEQPSAPPTNANEIALYSKDVSGATQLFMRRESNGTEINFTSSLQASSGWARLPSGILLKWGSSTPTRNTLGTVTFNTGAGIPVFTSIFSVMVCQTFGAGPSTGDLNLAVSAGNFTTTTFQVFGRAIGLPNSGTYDIRFLAIGI